MLNAARGATHRTPAFGISAEPGSSRSRDKPESLGLNSRASTPMQRCPDSLWTPTLCWKPLRQLPGSSHGQNPPGMSLPGARGAHSSHLHPVVLVIHVLQPGNELSRVETVSDRFVFVSLRTGQQREGLGLVLYFKQLQVSQIIFKPLLGHTLLRTVVPAGREDGHHCCQLLLQPFPGIQSQEGMHPCARTPCFSLLCRESVHVSPSRLLNPSDSFNRCQESSSTDTWLGNADG